MVRRYRDLPLWVLIERHAGGPRYTTGRAAEGPTGGHDVVAVSSGRSCHGGADAAGRASDKHRLCHSPIFMTTGYLVKRPQWRIGVSGAPGGNVGECGDACAPDCPLVVGI